MDLKSAIEKKLKSKIPLDEKCKLAKNTFLASVKAVHIPQKEEYILQWLVSLLLKKFSPCSQSIDEGYELWDLLLRLSESPKFDAAFVAACKDRIWDLLHCIVDYSSTLNSIDAPKQWMIVSLKSNKHLKAIMSQNQDELNLFTSKCVKRDFVIDDIMVFHLSTCQHKSELGNNFHEELLPALLTAKAKHPKVLKLINLCVFKNHSKQWELFLKTSLENQDDCKPKSDELLGSVMNKISSMSPTDQVHAVDMLYAAAIHSTAMSNHGKTQLFCVCCDIIQLSPVSEDSLKITPLASTVFLPKVKADLKTRLICLKSLISTSIEHKLDVNTILVRETPWLKYLQHLVKSLSNGQEALEEEAIDIILMLAQYSPSVIEPAIGSIALGIMKSPLNLSKKGEYMDQLLFLFQRLRQLPKLIARLLIAISKAGNEKKLSWTPDILKSFAANVVKLPTGQLLELWKTFDYHLKNNDPFNINTIDSLMSTFLLHSRLVEQSIPDITIDKVTASIKNTASLAEGLKVPLICTALAEMSLALTNIGHGSTDDQVKMVTWLQKRKLSSVISSAPVKRSKITWDDVASLPIGVIKVHLEDISSENLKENVEHIIYSLDEESIEENERIHDVIMESVLNKLRSRESKGKSKFLTALLKGSSRDEVAKAFECLEVTDEKDLEMLQKLPIEHLHGDLEAKMSLLALSVIKSSEILFARSLNSTFRPCSILKHLSVWQVLEILETCSSSRQQHQDQILQSLLKLSVTYQKPFEEIKQRKKELVNALLLENKSLTSSGSDIYWLKVSIFLMETLLPSISLSNEEKRLECKSLFKSMAKAYLAGDAKEMEDETLAIKALSIVLKQANISPDEQSAKKWKELTVLVNKKLGYCTENWKFLETILNCYSHLNNPQDILNSITSSKIHLKHLGSEDDAKVLRLFFQVTAAHATEESLQTMFDELLEATMTDSAYWNNWKYLAESKMPTEETHAKRREALEKVLSTMLVVSPCAHPAPMLEMYRSLLDLDKPVVYKEAESLCVSHVAQIDFRILLVNDQLVNFCQEWEAVYKILSTAFHKRPSAVVVARIPIVIRVVRNLIESLSMAANQKRNLQPTDIKKLVTLAHYFDRLCDHIRKLREEFGRVVPYFIGDVMNCFQKNTIYPHVRSNILRGIHKLLDSIDNHSVEYLSTVLPPGQQEMFKHIYSNYKHYHSYKGKV